MKYINKRIANNPRHARAALYYWADIYMLVTGIVAFFTGLILLTRFHMGEGSVRDFAFGLTRLAWVNLHRLSAAAALPGIMIHVGLHWRIIVARVCRNPENPTRKAKPSDWVLYFGYVAVFFEGFFAWLILPGAPGLYGPITLTHHVPARHLCIDLHNFTGLILLPAAAIHVRRHIAWMIRTAGSWLKRQEA